jgi:hypothetical protein
VIAAAATAALLAGAGAALAKTVLDRSAERQTFAEDVAERLGVSVEDLSQAWSGAANARVDRLLAEGSITEDQAERLRSRIDAGAPLAGGPGHLHRPGPLHRGFGPKLGAAAEYLELPPAELRAALRDGSSLAEVAGRQGKPVEGLKQTLLDGAAARLDAAEAAGRIDAERKQRLLDRLETHIDSLVERSGRLDRPHERRRGAAPPKRRS